MSHHKTSNSALSGYHVLDLTDEKGMFCSRLLADMGAEVIRIESPETNPARSSFFVASNLGKQSVTLNLGVTRGQELFRRLVKTADVLVESYPPGYLDRLGLGFAALSQLNPRLIMAAITNFGQNGPYRDYQSSGLVASALGGAMSACGEPDLPPLKPFGHQAYYSAGLFAAIGILLALRYRHISNKGQYLDISLQECVTDTLDHILVRYFYEGVIAKRQGSLYWNNAFHVFPCGDGYILLSLFYQWETLVEWLESEGMAEALDKNWDREQRLERLDDIIGVLARWTKNHTAAELVEKGQLMRFPWAKVNSIPDLLNSRQLEERNFWVEVDDPESGERCKFPGVPAKLSRSPWRVGRHVPTAGEHNKEVYGHTLGLSEKDIRGLVKKGVI